jgi:hypothetical protein
MAGKWVRVGQILKGDKNKSIKIDKDITLKAGERLQIFDPRKSTVKSPEEIARIPDFVVAEIFLGPPREALAKE